MVKDGADFVVTRQQPLRRRDGSIADGGHCEPGATRIKFVDDVPEVGEVDE